MWPRQPIHHVLIEARTVGELADLAEGVPPETLCYHIVEYRETHMLLLAHDTPFDSFLVSKDLPGHVVESLADRLGIPMSQIGPAAR